VSPLQKKPNAPVVGI